MIVAGTVTNGVVVPDPGLTLPEGARVAIAIEEPSAILSEPQGAPTIWERLLKHAGTVPGLPEDLAAQHDHYLHGTPKR